MFFRTLLLSNLLFVTALVHASDILDNHTGYYKIQQAYLSANDCEEAVRPVEYAGQFLRIKTNDEKPKTYSVSSCDGEDLEELQCNGYFKTTKLTHETSNGIEGFYFNARASKAKDGTPQCLFTALRRRVIPGKGALLRYERTDWGSLLADYSFECTREMAKTFFDAQSLKCSTHIVIDASKVSDLR